MRENEILDEREYKHVSEFIGIYRRKNELNESNENTKFYFLKLEKKNIILTHFPFLLFLFPFLSFFFLPFSFHFCFE